MSTELIVSEKDMSLVEGKVLNIDQLKKLFKHTPAKYVKKRPAKGGGTWNYVTGGYVKKVLNLMFGWNWDFEIVDTQVIGKEVIVKGRLTCRTETATIVKMQFGCKDVMCKKGTETPLSLGNDMKAAATDALKKCAAEIGIAADVYNSEEFREVQVIEDVLPEQKENQRIKSFIEKAKTINDLEKLDFIPESLEEQYQNKYLELTPRTNKL